MVNSLTDLEEEKMGTTRTDDHRRAPDGEDREKRVDRGAG